MNFYKINKLYYINQLREDLVLLKTLIYIIKRINSKLSKLLSKIIEITFLFQFNFKNEMNLRLNKIEFFKNFYCK
jgi:hypothetical protein